MKEVHYKTLLLLLCEDSTDDSTDVSKDDRRDESGEGGDDESIESVPESQ